MSDFANQIGRMTLLPPGAREFLRRRLIEAGGCMLIALGVVYWAALMSFHPSDPSFNNATGLPPLNLLAGRARSCPTSRCRVSAWPGSFSASC
jgi:hypothetical protein